MNITSYPNQRLPYSAKNKQWRKDNVNYLCAQADDQLSADYQRMQQNYDIYANIVSQEEMQQMCSTLGLDIGKGKDYIQAYNLAANKIKVLKGEELSRPWQFGVVSLNASAINEILRQRDREFRQYIDFVIGRETSMAMMKIQEAVAGLDPQQAEMRMQEMAEFENSILNPDGIEKKYKNFKTAQETAIHTLLKKAVTADKLKYKKAQAYENACITGLECVKVDYQNGQPSVEVLNPLGVAYHKSPEVEFIQDGDYVVYKKEMSLGDILDQWGDLMVESDIKDLRSRYASIYGLDAKYHSQDAYSPSHWEHLNYARSTTSVPHSGLHGQSTSKSFPEYVPVYTVYWKSQKRVGVLSWLDAYNKPQKELVSEEYEMPSEAVKVRVSDLFNKTAIKYYWIDSGVKYTLEWVYIPEKWQGIRIHDNIYLDIRPCEVQDATVENPYQCKLPIYGKAFDNMNTPVTCPMDRMKPWQKLYLFIMARFLNLVSTDYGVAAVLNTLMIDPNLGVEKTMSYLMQDKLGLYNPLANEEGAQLAFSTKFAEKLDLSNTQQISFYVEILRFIEHMIGVSAGIPQSREGLTRPNTNVADNQSDLIQSSLVSLGFVASHELLWEDVLTGLVKLYLHNIRTGKTYIDRFILSDEEIAVIKLKPQEFSDAEMGVIISNNSRAARNLEILRSQAHAILQNDKRGLSILSNLLDTDNFSEFKHLVTELEDDIAKREQELLSQQIQRESEMQERMEIEKEKDHQRELEKIHLKGQWSYKTAVEDSMELNERKNRELDIEKIKLDKADEQNRELNRLKEKQIDRKAAEKN